MSSTPRPVSPLSTAEGAAADGALASARPGRSVLEKHPPMPTPSSIEPLLVTQLRAELEARGLDSSGRKAELQKRLLEAQLQEWQASLEQRDAALRTMVEKADRKAEQADRKAEQADRRAKAAERKAEKADRRAKAAERRAKENKKNCDIVARYNKDHVHFELKKQGMKIAYLEREAGIDLSGIDRMMEEERNGGANLDGGDGSETVGDGSGVVEEGNENESGEE